MAKAKSQVQVIDLELATDRDRFDVDSFVSHNPSFDDYLLSSKPAPYVFQDMLVFPLGSNSIFVEKSSNLVYGSFDDPLETTKNADNCSFDDTMPSGILLPKKYKPTHPETKQYDTLILTNADEEDNWEENSVWFSDGHVSLPQMTNAFTYMPSILFFCLGQMLDNLNSAFRQFANGSLLVLDYTREETIKLTKKESSHVSKKGSGYGLVPPQLGFSYVSGKWHRSGFVLLHQKKPKGYFLFGQDEGSYFGCQLPKPVKTIDEAFSVLMPKEVQGKPVNRQGEWFAIEVDEKDVPNTKDCALQFDGGEDNVFLPLETTDSKRHTVDTIDGRVGKDGKVYAKNPVLRHEDHQSLVLLQNGSWWTFYRNTALRSVSITGVD